MADYYTQFSSIIRHITKKERKWLEQFLSIPDEEALEDEALLKKWMEERDNPPYDVYDEEPEFWPHFQYEFTKTEDGKTGFWIHSYEYGNLDFIEHVVQCFLKKFRPKECFTLEWSNTCSKLRTDGFGGGALFVTAEEKKFISTSSWLDGEISFFNGKDCTNA